MKKFLQKKLKEQKGMTLIELLAVIVIIAIIAAIAIPAIGNIIENSRFGAAKSDVLNALSAADLYIAEEDTDPADVGDIVPLYMEASDTLDATGTTFARASSTAPITIAGTVTVNGTDYTLPASSKTALSGLSSAEFKDLITP
ncbi:prepilin-type N-terminal cleavage/methylation domain-containing protein [Planococcus glaciei]|uniref:prepilin-type N-terminal cleavage/methylation domain-containing protein n=1 Tax=Planococcus glaciei TaxID=459472 RepID=UPI001C73BD97|nr:prepilin-type N-terminal cleavage/methylation domain-containing protein [Planococcus glaciei]MBX0315077.1 prepilin-type N-terminal cleavage/methylation domain-containing protein [Planococcus glaciei]